MVFTWYIDEKVAGDFDRLAEGYPETLRRKCVARLDDNDLADDEFGDEIGSNEWDHAEGKLDQVLRALR